MPFSQDSQAYVPQHIDFDNFLATEMKKGIPDEFEATANRLKVNKKAI